ncbi:MAG: sugar-binding protein, partial [Planctomycetota bacterium]
MSNRLLGVGLVAVLLFSALVAGCGQREPGKIKLVMVPKGVHPYYEPCYEGFRDAARNYSNVEVEYEAPGAFELPAQVKVIEDLIARQVDGMAISALDNEGLVSVIDDAVSAGIKVITFDAPAPSSRALSYIGTLNEAAGYAGGLAMIQAMDGEGEVAVLQGGLGAANLNARFEGFKKAVEEKGSGITIVTREDTEGKLDTTVDKTEALLEAHPNLKGIFGVSAFGAPGAAAVIKERGKVGQIIVGGFDDMPDTLAAIRQGTVRFCLAKRTDKMGWLSLVKLMEAVEGRPIEKEIDTGIVVVTLDNVDTYMDEMKA